MTLINLSHEQQVALVALMEAIAISDGEVSEIESQELGKVADALGEEVYRALLDEAETKFTNVNELKGFLLTITDPVARQNIFGAALDEAMVEITFDGNDTNLLDWLAKAWEIRVDIQPEQ